MEDQELIQPRGGSFLANSPVRGCFASTMALVPSSDYGGIVRALPLVEGIPPTSFREPKDFCRFHHFGQLETSKTLADLVVL